MEEIGDISFDPGLPGGCLPHGHASFSSESAVSSEQASPREGSPVISRVAASRSGADAARASDDASPSGVILQQLGRGLRRAEGKSVLTVLDFVGHQHRSFRFDLRYRAINGDSRQELVRPRATKRGERSSRISLAHRGGACAHSTGSEPLALCA